MGSIDTYNVQLVSYEIKSVVLGNSTAVMNGRCQAFPVEGSVRQTPPYIPS